MSYIIRQANINDSQDILDVYKYYITDTVASFEIDVPTIEVFSKRVHDISENYPYILCYSDDELLGFAYAAQHRERAAYKYDVDVSIYVKNGNLQQGIGTKLYQRLFEELSNLEFYNAYSGITLPNEKSVNIHHKFGFKDIGVYTKTGYKMGKWLDVLWLEKQLKDYESIK